MEREEEPFDWFEPVIVKSPEWMYGSTILTPVFDRPQGDVRTNGVPLNVLAAVL